MKRRASCKRVLVLGLGNILLQDEGAGVRLVERFELPHEIEALDGGTSGMELIDRIADRDALLVCDAIRSDSPPGTVLRIPGSRLPALLHSRISPHQVGLSDLLAALTLLEKVPPSVTLIGIVPELLDLGTELSPVVELALEEALALLVDEIELLGIRLRGSPQDPPGIYASG